MSGGKNMTGDSARLWEELHTMKEDLAATRDELILAKDELAELRSARRASSPKALEPQAPVTRSAELQATDPEEVHSRRGLLKKVGVGAAVTAAGVVSASSQAAAADGDPVTLGATTNEATTPTSSAGQATTGSNAFTFEDATATWQGASSFPSTLAAYTSSAQESQNAFYAWCNSRIDDDEDTGHAIIATAAGSARSQIRLVTGIGDPNASSVAHRFGEIVFDVNRNLWLCTSSGTPGTWTKIAGPATAGAFHPVTPKRVWDTRFQGGQINGNQSRVISVADGRALGAATVDQANLVPVGATAVTFNLTLISRSNTGFLAVTPGDATSFEASAINWTSNNATLANGTLSALDDSRELRLWTSETGAAHAIVDITGYYL